MTRIVSGKDFCIKTFVMPLKKARGKSSKSIQKAVTKNYIILNKENSNRDKPRSQKQIGYLAYKAAKGKL